jgi:hypothetical protein
MILKRYYRIYNSVGLFAIGRCVSVTSSGKVGVFDIIRGTYTGSKYEVNTYIPGYRVEVISQWQAIKFIHSPSYCGEPFVT